MYKRVSTLLLVVALGVLCAGLGAVIASSHYGGEPDSHFMACFSGDTPLYVGEIRGEPDVSGNRVSFYSVEHTSVVNLIGASCVRFTKPP